VAPVFAFWNPRPAKKQRQLKVVICPNENCEEEFSIDAETKGLMNCPGCDEVIEVR
jgi:hypothetical protein